jgi:hypothetical protein
MKASFNRSEIFALAHNYRRQDIQCGWKVQSFKIYLIRAWAFARGIMKGVRQEIADGHGARTNYGSSYIVVTLPWSNYEEFRTGKDARKIVAMPAPMQNWFNSYGAC